MSYTAIFDLETDGLLPELTRVHCLVIRIPEFDRTLRFRNNKRENTIARGLKILEEADLLVGHNILHFDLPALEKLYPDFNATGRVRDTLVLARMVFADEKDRDFRRFARGELPGKYIGQHKLEAWGFRLGKQKDEYSARREAEAKAKGITEKAAITRYVWGEWNQEMDDYCVTDVEVTELLWDSIQQKGWAEESVILEHQIHELMGLQERSGIYFDVTSAEQVCAVMEANHKELSDRAITHFGKWFAPAKKYTGLPRAAFGEDDSRRSWAEVVVPKKSIKYKDPTMGERQQGCPYCAVKVKEFNPNSRPMIIDRLQTIYDWEPVDFTEKGNPKVDDKVLTKLAKQVPIAEDLAEIFFYSKILGMLAWGKEAWLSKVTSDSFIHHYCNVGGTVTGRASHVGPNLAQVPKVKTSKVLNDKGAFEKKVLGPDGQPIADCFKPDGTLKKTVVLKGRAGEYGWESRALFGPKPGWFGFGADLKGIEGRCFGGRMAEFDHGEYLDIVLNGDIHATNMVAFQLDDRDKSKTTYYALMYGAGDEKLGSIVCPPLTLLVKMKARGRALRNNFETGIPAFGALMRKLKKEAKKGYLIGLDGRRVYVRSPHAVLNVRLQHDGALIAKKWNLLFHRYMEDAGLVFGWDADYVQMLWIHDEIQGAARTHEIAAFAGEMLLKSAVDAGVYFNYPAPVEADFKLGLNWAETH